MSDLNVRELIRAIAPDANPDTMLDPSDGRRNTHGPMLTRAKIWPGSRLLCKLCGEWKPRCYADLNGRAFEDYYCETCIEEVLR